MTKPKTRAILKQTVSEELEPTLLAERNVQIKAFECIVGRSPNSYEVVLIQYEGRVLATIVHDHGDMTWRCSNRQYNSKEAATEHEMQRILAGMFSM